MQHHRRQVSGIVGVHRYIESVLLVLQVQLACEYVTVLRVRLHVALVHDCAQRGLLGLSFLLLQQKAIHEKLTLLEALDLETGRRLWVKLTQVSEDVAFEAHDAILFNLSVLAEVVKDVLRSLSADYIGAELHTRVQVEQKLIVAKDCISRHDDSRLINVSFALDFEGRMVQCERPLHREVKLLHLILGTNQSQSTRLGLLVASCQ